MLVGVLASVTVQEGNKTPSRLREDQRHPQAPPNDDTPTLFHLCHMLALLLLLHVSSASVGKALEPLQGPTVLFPVCRHEILAEHRYSGCIGVSGLIPRGPPSVLLLFFSSES